METKFLQHREWTKEDVLLAISADGSPPRDPSDDCPTVSQHYCLDPTTNEIYFATPVFDSNGCIIDQICEDRDGDGDPEDPFPPLPPFPCQIETKYCVDEDGFKTPATPTLDEQGCVTGYTCPDGSPPVDPPEGCRDNVFQEYCYDPETGEIFPLLQK